MNMNKVNFANQENHTRIYTKSRPINLHDAPQFLIEISPMSIMLKSTMNLFMHFKKRNSLLKMLKKRRNNKDPGVRMNKIR